MEIGIFEVVSKTPYRSAFPEMPAYRRQGACRNAGEWAEGTI